MTPSPHHKLNSILLAVLFLLGLFFPTSSHGEILMEYYLAQTGVGAALLLILLMANGGLRQRSQLWIGCGIIATLLFFTIFQPFPDYALGAIGAYVVYAILLCLDLSTISASRLVSRLFFAFNLVGLTLEVLTLQSNAWVTGWIIDNYSAFYPELVSSMLNDYGKPVLTFASHSIAGFFFYVFFLLNFKTYEVKGRIVDLAFTLGWLYMTFAVASVTSYIFAALAGLQLLFFFVKRDRLVLIGLLSLVGVALAIYHGELLDFVTQQGEKVSFMLSSQTNGWLGRYSADGALQSDINYLFDNPFRPIGLGYSDQLFFGDSGPIEYLLRGSIFLLILMYAGFYRFVRRNLIDRGDRWLIFFVFFAFEFGYSDLLYPRTLYLLPFFVIYLNDLRRLAPQVAAPAPAPLSLGATLQ